ncbi:hypothetical protein CQA48_30290, partial [Klebsiella pneumoniae]
SQPNVLMIKLVSVVFFVTVTVALGGVLLIIKWTLQIPFLAVALIVVFYVSQPNVLMIKLVSVVFFVTVTVALGGVLLIIKWT